MKSPPFRFWIGVMIFFTAFTNYMLKANISVSIVEMVAKGKRTIPVCERYMSVNITTGNETIIRTSTDEKFDWDEHQQAYILAGYFYGYLVGLIPAGFLAEIIGPCHVIMWSSVASAVLTALTPLSTLGGPYGIMANRIIVGLLGGLVYPALNTLIAKWAPPTEKGKFIAATLGNNLGAVFSFNIVGLVTHYYGWPWGFYVLVIVMGVFCIFFYFFVADNPSKSRWTSEEERNFIFKEQEGHLSAHKAVAPYRKILTSLPFLAACVAQFGNLWGLILIITYSPKYMYETLGFDIKASAGLSAFPYIARLVFAGFFGVIGDILRQSGIMTVGHIRKFFIIFSHFLPAVCFFLIRLAGCNPLGVVILLVANQGLNGAVVASHLINVQDLTPNFAGSCFAIMEFVGSISGIIVPVITGFLNVYYNKELKAAAFIFAIGGIIFTVTGIVFIIFGSGRVQPWNEIKETARPQGQKQDT